MFENSSPNPPVGAANQDEPVDMFDHTDGIIEPGEIKSALANQKLRPVTAGNQQSAAGSQPLGKDTIMAESRTPVAGSGQQPVEIESPVLSKKSLFLLIGIILVIVVGAGIGFALWRTSKKTSSQPPVGGNQQPAVSDQQSAESRQLEAERGPQPPPVVGPPATPETPPPAPPVVNEAPLIQSTPPPPPVDADGDGLNDEAEAQQGTDPAKIDTDEDGLTDYEEVIIWKSNPLTADTDGDGYSDGTEVKNGYNPLGAGRLLQVPQP